MNISMKTVMSFVLLFGIVAVAQDVPPAVNIPIGESAFTVAARSAKQYKFVVPAGASAVRLEPLHCHRRAAQQHRGLGDERRPVCELGESTSATGHLQQSESDAGDPQSDLAP